MACSVITLTTRRLPQVQVSHQKRRPRGANPKQRKIGRGKRGGRRRSMCLPRSRLSKLNGATWTTASNSMLRLTSKNNRKPCDDSVARCAFGCLLAGHMRLICIVDCICQAQCATVCWDAMTLSSYALSSPTGLPRSWRTCRQTWKRKGSKSLRG